jgi:hypothetical protein
MNVGDPVTLRISLAGPPSLADAELPALGGIERLVDGFVLGSDPPAVELRDGEKIFRQTVRVKREDVTEIPPIEVSFFNTRTRSYQVAASRPYPITVRPTRIVTAEDLVGEETSGQVRVRSWDEGILHNVPSSAGLLRRDSYRAGSMFGRPGVAAALGLSLLGLVAALVYAMRQRMAAAALADTEAAPIREASLPLRRLEDRLERAAANQGLAAGEAGLESLREALAALRAYLQTRLGLRPGRISAEAVETELERRGIEEALCQELRELLARQESLRFSGGRPGSPGGGSGLPGGPSSPGDRDLGEEIRELLLRTRELAGKLEQRLSAP